MLHAAPFIILLHLCLLTLLFFSIPNLSLSIADPRSSLELLYLSASIYYYTTISCPIIPSSFIQLSPTIRTRQAYSHFFMPYGFVPFHCLCFLCFAVTEIPAQFDSAGVGLKRPMSIMCGYQQHHQRASKGRSRVGLRRVYGDDE